MQDLSLFHYPIDDLFAAQVATCWLNDEQIAFYKTHGYLAGLRLLDDKQVERLRSELAQLSEPSHPGNELFYEYHSNESTDPRRILFHALGAWRVAAGFHDLLWNPAFLLPASQLLEGPVRFWHDQIFYKPAHHGGVVAWHQDYSYWTRTTPMAHLSCWIGLDDSTRENGCVHYVPSLEPPANHRTGRQHGRDSNSSDRRTKSQLQTRCDRTEEGGGLISSPADGARLF